MMDLPIYEMISEKSVSSAYKTQSIQILNTDFKLL